MSEELKERRFLIRRPRALQYFYRGELRKEGEKERVAGRFELFFDLLYVAIIANLADDLTEDATPASFLKFVLIFTPAWHAWADAKENANNYYNDDILQRIGILWVMALLVFYGNNASFVDENITAMRTTVVAYMVLRFTQICFYAMYSIASHHHRVQNRFYFGMIFVGMFIWIPLLLESVSIKVKVVVAIVGILFEEISYVLTFGPWIARWLNLEYTTAVDIDHETDRYTAFTILVLGEFTYAILVGSPAAGGLNSATLRAVWTLVIAFCLNSMYVYQDGSIASTHPIRRSVGSAFGWLLIHLPLSAALMIGGHVSAATVQENELDQGQRWLWGGGLGVGTFGLLVIAWMYKDDDEPGLLRFAKPVRLLPRLLTSIIFVLLPLIPANDISPTKLLSIGTGMMVFTVAWETYGSLETDACFIESWKSQPIRLEDDSEQAALAREYSRSDQF